MSGDEDTAEGKLTKIARGEYLSPFEQIARGQISSLSDRLEIDGPKSLGAKVTLDHLETFAAKLANDFGSSPMQDLVKHGSPDGGAKFLNDIARLATVRGALEQPVSLSTFPATTQQTATELGQLSSFGTIVSTIDPSLMRASQGLQPPEIDLAFGRAMQEAEKSLENAIRPLGGIDLAVKHFEEQQRVVQESLIASLAGPLGDIARTGQWASTIGQISTPDVVNLLGGSVAAAFDDIRASIDGAFTKSVAADQLKISELLGLNSRIRTEFETTRLKMSVLAGFGETFDPHSSFRTDAYHALFGDWRSHSDLPENFWSDSRVRKRMYRDAEVDDGLIEATPGMAVEIMIESGLTAGLRSDANAVAVFALGEVSMTVRSRGTRKDAYAALDRFEQEMRNFISRKLEERFGQDWFKARASNLIGKAKQVRKAAMQRGEAFALLIQFVDLGDLSGIILNGNNWNEIFGEIFINRTDFDQDMQKLIAVRRPTMHSRPIDGVRLVEMLCVMQRLSQQMADDGAWKNVADSDR